MERAKRMELFMQIGQVKEVDKRMRVMGLKVRLKVMKFRKTPFLAQRSCRMVFGRPN